MSEENKIDESLYSRQIYVLGLEAMKKMSQSSILISGIGGLGVEIAKNVILAGVRKVTIHDTKNATMIDLSSQFYLTEKDIGLNRAAASVKKLAELNQYVLVSAETCDLTESFLSQFNTVVIADFRPLSELIKISNFCHQKGIYFIATQTCGVFSMVFDDFGKQFVVKDPIGETPTRFLIEHITKAKEGIVTVADGGLHGLSDGQFVRFEEVPGMTELNGKTLPIKVKNARKFSIGDTSEFGDYTFEGSGGYGNQVFGELILDFDSFEESLSSMPLLEFDYSNFGRERHTLLGFLSTSKFADDHPTLDIAKNPDMVLSIAHSLNEKYKICEVVNDSLVKLMAEHCLLEISPMAAVFGGIVGQEILKSLSGKFTPIKQFFCLSYMEALNPGIKGKAIGDRYDAYRIVFGNEQHEKMMDLNYFMIGSGAIGCEVLKNWAMMGVSAGTKGKIYLTDMDSIEKSNLSRQFLFRDRDIGKMKSECAAAAAIVMNPSMKIEAMTSKLANETRNVFSDEFYMGLDGVCNALDNVHARLYSDQQCVFYKKPLLESGTLGPMASFQVVVPHLTESYSSSADPPEKTIPQCTVHNFPSIIDHCCQWARDIFTGLFEQPVMTVNKFIEDKDNFIKDLRAQNNEVLLSSLETVVSYIGNGKPANFVDCVKWAKRKFYEYFNWRIRDLLNRYPLDSITSMGTPFWSGSKRAPEFIEFDPNNQIHSEFVISSAKIIARVYGILETQDDIISIANSIKCDDYVIHNIEDTEKEAKIVSDNDPKLIELLEKAKNLSSVPLFVEKFEKDDDSNGHMDFVAAASNLRAMNYRINTESKLEIKRIAGKIIPAIATTTAMVCGFVCLEMYKLHSIETKPLSDYRSGFLSLAISMFSLSEPTPCKKKVLKTTNQAFTLWDTYQIEGDLTIKEFIDQVKERWNMAVMSMTVEGRLVYADFYSAMKKKDCLPKKITAVYERLFKTAPPPNQHLLRIEAVCYNESGVEVECPPFTLAFRK